MRKDVWKSGPGWNDTLLWYAKGVAALQTRAIDDPTSWRYLAAMHGFDEELWGAFGYLGESDALPSAANQGRFWKQCQHQAWYFLPWHRGYLSAFELMVRAAIVQLGGPLDWALPYWNYSDESNPNALNLPSAFQAETLPDGTPNPLKLTRRYGDGTGNVVIHQQDVGLNALRESRFAGAQTGGSTGFGGPATLFHHASPDGGGNGQLERQPHNGVHGLVGGRLPNADPRDPRNYGLMSMPDTAALDPIFWLHHANIDRLWEVWIKRNTNHHNPANSAWLAGPADRKFAMPKPDGMGHDFIAQDVLDTTAPELDYIYEDVSDPLGGANRLAMRFERLSLPSGAFAGIAREVHMAGPQAAELIGANASAVRLEGGMVETRVPMDRDATRKVASSFRSEALSSGAPKEPDRVFLNLENIKGANDAAVFYVYVNLPQNANPQDHPEHLAGVVSLFGVKKATRPDDAHGGNGINEVLEITDLVDTLHLNNALNLDHLTVRFVPRTNIRPEDNISVGRVSVYRQGQ